MPPPNDPGGETAGACFASLLSHCNSGCQGIKPPLIAGPLSAEQGTGAAAQERTARCLTWWGTGHPAGRSAHSCPASHTHRAASTQIRGQDSVTLLDIRLGGECACQACGPRPARERAPHLLPGSFTSFRTKEPPQSTQLAKATRPTLDGTSVRYSAGMIWSVSMFCKAGAPQQ